MTIHEHQSNTLKQSASLGLLQIVAYALPKLPVSFLLGIIAILPGIYAKYFGLSLTTIATLILVARVLDTVTDPIIGYCSDWYFTRHGSRKPFVVVGGVLFAISSYFLFVPVDLDTLNVIEPHVVSATSNVSATHFLLCLFALTLALTLFEIPHYAWGSELTASAQERNKLFGFNVFNTFLGQMLFFLVPLLGVFESSQFTPYTLHWSAVIGGLSLLPLLYISMVSVPNGNRKLLNLSEKIKNRPSFKNTLQILTKNIPFLLVVAALFFGNIAIGMWLALLFIFVDSHLGWGHQLPIAFCVSYGVGALSVWAWCRLANRMGKKLIMNIGLLVVLIGILGTSQLSSESSWLLLLLSMVLVYCGMAALFAVDPSLLADIVDYGTWKFGYDQTATYFAINTIATKISAAIGGALGLATAGWYGFDPAININNDEAIYGLYLAIAWLPAPFILTALVCITLISINTRRHKIIRRSLDARQARAAAVNTTYQPLNASPASGKAACPTL